MKKQQHTEGSEADCAAASPIGAHTGMRGKASRTMDSSTDALAKQLRPSGQALGKKDP